MFLMIKVCLEMVQGLIDSKLSTCDGYSPTKLFHKANFEQPFKIYVFYVPTKQQDIAN